MMTRLLPSIVVTGLLACTAGTTPVVAQDDQNLEEVSAYHAWYAANAAGDAAKAMELAQTYVERFPSGQYADYLGKWLAGTRWSQFNETIKKKDMAGMVKLGQARLQSDPQDLNYLYWMALNLRQHELLGSAEAVHAEQAQDFSRRSIELIAGGGQPVGVDAAKWDKDANLAWLHQNVALAAAKLERHDQALEHYEKSSALAPKDTGLNLRNSFGCGTIRKAKYDQAVARYQALPEAERSGEAPGDAAKAAVEEANREADAAIECWARFLALSEGGAGGDARSRVEQALAALYAYRHPDDPEGYKGLVAKHKPGS